MRENAAFFVEFLGRDEVTVSVIDHDGSQKPFATDIDGLMELREEVKRAIAAVCDSCSGTGAGRGPDDCLVCGGDGVAKETEASR